MKGYNGTRVRGGGSRVFNCGVRGGTRVFKGTRGYKGYEEVREGTRGYEGTRDEGGTRGYEGSIAENESSIAENESMPVCDALN